MSQERRHNRSDDVATALESQLQASASRLGLSDVVVGDTDGFLVAANKGMSSGTEELAAYLPIFYEQRGWFDMAAQAPKMVVRRFSALGLTLYMGVVGRRGPDVEQEMRHAMEGVKRILH
jgi:hypothetical protein